MQRVTSTGISISIFLFLCLSNRLRRWPPASVFKIIIFLIINCIIQIITNPILDTLFKDFHSTVSLLYSYTISCVLYTLQSRFCNKLNGYLIAREWCEPLPLALSRGEASHCCRRVGGLVCPGWETSTGFRQSGKRLQPTHSGSNV
jgi:hypothetical protein